MTSNAVPKSDEETKTQRHKLKYSRSLAYSSSNFSFFPSTFFQHEDQKDRFSIMQLAPKMLQYILKFMVSERVKSCILNCIHRYLSTHIPKNPHALRDEKSSIHECPLFSLHRWHIHFEM